MSDLRAATASTPRRAPAPPAWYAAAVVGLAAFLGGTLVTHPPIRGYRTEATLLRANSTDQAAGSSVQPAPIDPATAEDWLKSPVQLQQIAAGIPSGDKRGSNLPSVSDDEIASIKSGLQLEVSGTPEAEQWTIQFEGRDRNQAKRIAKNVAAALAGYLERASDTRPREPELAAMRREVRVAQEEEERLQDEIEQLRHEQLAAALLRQREQAAMHSAALRADQEREPAAKRRDGIVQKIDELRIEYRKLVAVRLTNHPSVAAVAGQIEQLEAQLREPSDLKDVAPDEAPKPGMQLHGPSAAKPRSVTEATFTSARSADSGVSLDSAAPIASRIDDARRRLREAAAERNSAERRLEVALQLASTAWQKQWSIGGCSPAQRLGGTPDSKDLMWAGIVGIIAATTISIDWTWFRRLRVLATATQARNALSAPLLGEIALPAGRPMPQHNVVSPVKARAIRMAEWMLIVALFLIILAAVSQRELAAQLASDPFGAMAEAFDTVRSLGR